MAIIIGAAVFLLGPHSPKLDGTFDGDPDLAARTQAFLGDDLGLTTLHVSVIARDSATHAGLGHDPSGKSPNHSTPMPLGSITKTLNGQLLADSMRGGTLSPDRRGQLPGPARHSRLPSQARALPVSAEKTFLYSSVGATLLGDALARAAGIRVADALSCLALT